MEYVLTTLQDDLSVRELITLFYFEHDPHFVFTGESHDFWELNYIDKGELICHVDGEQVVLNQGDLILYPPNVYHSHHCNGVDSVNMTIVSFTCNNDLLKTVGNQVLQPNDRQKAMLDSIVVEAQQAFSSPLTLFVSCELVRRVEKTFAAEQLIRLNLEMLLIELLRSRMAPLEESLRSSFKSASDNEKTERIKMFLKDSVYSRITITDICAHLSLSPTCIKTIFRQAVGTPIMTYYTQLKITEAKRLLRRGLYSISDVSNLLSYSSTQYFSKHFKKVTGMTPSEYASSIKAKADHD